MQQLKIVEELKCNIEKLKKAIDGQNWRGLIKSG